MALALPASDPLAAGLARALRGEAGLSAEMIRAAPGHGVAPLLHARTPSPALRTEAQARAMWELRHRAVLARLTGALAAAGLQVALMKGTALAYDLFAEPAQRPRGDSDLLARAADVAQVRAILRAQGFVPFYAQESDPGAGRTQEPWSLRVPDGSSHDVDLHWEVLNAAALEHVLPVEDVLAQAAPLPRLSPAARGIARHHALILAALHRAQHIHSPYFVNDVAVYGGDRLIWLVDIDLLSRALTPAEWDLVVTRSSARGVAPVVLGALQSAADLLDTPLPADVVRRLTDAPPGPGTAYLLQRGRLGRVLSDLRARGPARALGAAWRRACPPAEYMRMQFAGSTAPLPVLYLRRLLGLLRGPRA
jgi:hypothetical protein